MEIDLNKLEGDLQLCTEADMDGWQPPAVPLWFEEALRRADRLVNLVRNGDYDTEKFRKLRKKFQQELWEVVLKAKTTSA